MITRRIALGSAGAALAASLLEAQAPAAGRKVVFEHDIPELLTKNWGATLIEITYAPGESSTPHRHPGITIAYVIEGEIRSKVGDGPEQTYAAGQAFIETPNQLHAGSRNASATKPARFLAIMLAEKGKPLTVPA